MPRLFSALLLPEPVRHDLAARLDEVSPPELAGWRWIPVTRWHITLGFFGDDDDERRRSKWLRRRAAGRPAPRLRLAGCGTFRGVFWVGVTPEGEPDRVALAKVAQAAGAGRQDDRRAYQPHLTVARWKAHRGGRSGADRAVPGLLDGYAGPWFTPEHVVLMRSDQGPDGPVYHTIERIPLAGA